MFENDRGEVLSYFKRRGKLGLLADQPDNVISKVIQKSTVSRIKGCHMNDKMKDAGENLYLDGYGLNEDKEKMEVKSIIWI